MKPGACTVVKMVQMLSWRWVNVREMIDFDNVKPTLFKSGNATCTSCGPAARCCSYRGGATGVATIYCHGHNTF